MITSYHTYKNSRSVSVLLAICCLAIAVFYIAAIFFMHMGTSLILASLLPFMSAFLPLAKILTRYDVDEESMTLTVHKPFRKSKVVDISDIQTIEYDKDKTGGQKYELVRIRPDSVSQMYVYQQQAFIIQLTRLNPQIVVNDYLL